MRHAERIDLTFGYGTWLTHCFDESGKYVRKDLNMPERLPERSSGPQGFLKDSPLTQIGLHQALILGETFKETNPEIEHVYCSPAYRCVQTCDAVLRGLGIKEKFKMRLEPGLFEWLVWYPEGLPDWMSSDELITAGYNIDVDYAPFVSRTELIDSQETCEKFYTRSAFVSQSVTSLHKTGNILFVGHAATLDVCTREMLGESPRPSNEMTKLLHKVPYCSMVVVEKCERGWAMIQPPCPPLTHSNNLRFEWKNLNEPF